VDAYSLVLCGPTHRYVQAEMENYLHNLKNPVTKFFNVDGFLLHKDHPQLYHNQTPAPFLPLFLGPEELLNPDNYEYAHTASLLPVHPLFCVGRLQSRFSTTNHVEIKKALKKQMLQIETEIKQLEKGEYCADDDDTKDDKPEKKVVRRDDGEDEDADEDEEAEENKQDDDRPTLIQKKVAQRYPLPRFAEFNTPCKLSFLFCLSLLVLFLL
jgi:hypothetical protein